MGIREVLTPALSHKNGFVRKGAIALLSVPKWWAGFRVKPGDLAACPPVVVNSFPKSGTHLLMQLVEGLPERRNYGAFLASMTSSFQFRERSPRSVTRFFRGFVPGEIVRAHLFFEEQYADELAKKSTVHFFIYRDPRDIVVSEAHYLCEMNRWHRLAPFFRRLHSIEEAISLSIDGFQPPVAGIDYPNVAARFGRYQGWLNRENTLAIRFEDLRSERQSAIIEQMAEFYAARSSVALDVAACARTMAAHVAPHKSHTFRSGKKAGWQREFTAEHRRRFAEVAGDVLIQLGYEPNHDWATTPLPSSV
jgi:sulfotransferase family protein